MFRLSSRMVSLLLPYNQFAASAVFSAYSCHSCIGALQNSASTLAHVASLATPQSATPLLRKPSRKPMSLRAANGAHPRSWLRDSGSKAKRSIPLTELWYRSCASPAASAARRPRPSVPPLPRLLLPFPPLSPLMDPVAEPPAAVAAADAVAAAAAAAQAAAVAAVAPATRSGCVPRPAVAAVQEAAAVPSSPAPPLRR